MPKLSPDAPLLHPDVTAVNCRFGGWVEIGRGSVVLNSTFDNYSYCDRYADIANTHVGRFANIAAMTRIGPTDHPWQNAAQHHFLYRSSYYWDDAPDDADFFACRAAHGAGARLLAGPWRHRQARGDRGRRGHRRLGPVATKDVAPFTIVAGVPAQPIRTRFAQGVIDRLMALAWWDRDHARLRAALADFRSLRAEEFLDRYEPSTST